MALVPQDRIAAEIDSPEPEVQCNALATLANFGGDAASKYYDKVLPLASSSSPLVKRAALAALARTAKGKESEAAPVLEDALGSADSAVRCTGARGLGILKAEGSVGKLHGCLSDDSMMVRNAAMAALGAIGAKAGSSAKEVAENLRAPLLRVEAIRALGKLGKDGAAYAQQIAVHMEDSDHNMRIAVSDALRDMGDAVPQSVVDKAGGVLDHQCDRYRATAALAVGSCGMAKGGNFVAVLKRMLKENASCYMQPELTPNCAAAIALGRLGTEGEVLVNYLQSKNAYMRAAVCKALAEMGKAGLSYAPAIVKALEDDELEVQAAALKALETLEKSGSLDSNTVAAMKAFKGE